MLMQLKDLKQVVSERTTLTPRQASTLLKALTGTIREELKAGNTIDLGFCTLTPKVHTSEAIKPGTHERYTHRSATIKAHFTEGNL